MGKKGYKERHINMKVFVTGVAGQLGHDVVNELTKRGHEAIGSDIANRTLTQIDLGVTHLILRRCTEEDTMTQKLIRVRPTFIT